MNSVFCGHGFYENDSSKEGIPFYAVAPTIQKALVVMTDTDPNLDVASIDRFDYVPVISRNITQEDCNNQQVKAFVIRTRTDVFAEFMYHTEQVDRVFRAFFVVGLNHTEAIDELFSFLDNLNQLKNLTVVGVDKIQSEYKIFVDFSDTSLGD